MPTKPPPGPGFRRSPKKRPAGETTSTRHDKLDDIIVQLGLALHNFNLLVDIITKLEKTMSAELDAIKAAVQKNTDAELAAADLLRRLSQLITDSINDKPALQQLAADVNAQADALAAAVTATTPAA